MKNSGKMCQVVELQKQIPFHGKIETKYFFIIFIVFGNLSRKNFEIIY